MRTDLNMRRGKQIAQGAHASLGVILAMMNSRYEQPFGALQPTEVKELYLFNNTPIEKWINGIFTKIGLRIGSEKELLELYEQAKNAKLPTILITDNGITEFNGVPTKTCIAIGPGYEKDIDKITSHLKLL